MELREQLVARALEKELVLENSAVDLLCSLPDALDVLDRIASSAEGKLFVSRGDVEAFVELTEEDEKAPVSVVVEREDFKPASRDLEPDLKFYDSRDVTGKSGCTGSIEDFIDYFRDRFRETRKVLRGAMSELPLVDSIGRLKAFGAGKSYRVVGMVYDKKVTKNNHLIVELEDEDGFLTCLFPKDSPVLKKGERLLHDEVVAVDGYLSNSLFIAKEVVWPDLPLRQRKVAGVDAYAALISDLHVGSKFFLHDKFRRFLGFLNGEGSPQEQEMAGKIKYLLVGGDTVDGIGIYPSQEKHLVTKDIYAQYELLEEMLASIPEHVEIIIIPGNHDAVRLAEPQPRLSEGMLKRLSVMRNVHLLGNPCWFEMHGIKTLMYHGTSLDTIIASLNERDGYNQPDKVAIELLRRRHLSPVYGEKPMVPEKKDYMFVSDSPDLFHFGHVHKNAYAEYRGVTIINSGTWQDTTDLQMRLGHVPTPCRLPLYSLDDGSIKVLSFGQ